MHVILTIIKLDELPVLSPGAADYLDRFDAVSLRLDAWTQEFGQRLDATNTERQGWAWINFKRGAAALGKAHGLACEHFKLRVFYANAELDYSNATNPYVEMLAYIQAFRAYAPTTTKLAYNGFSWDQSSEGKLLHNARMMQLFDIWCPMNYGTDAKTIEDFWVEKNFRYARTAPITVYPMVGVGRIDSKGNQWGFWYDQGQYKGLRSLLAESVNRIGAVCFYFGNGAQSQMLVGNKKHPAIVDIAEELHFNYGFD